jgi:hypothetical protein
MMHRILVMEDDGACCVALAEFLREAGHHVRCASDAETGLEALRHLPFDLLLLDVKIPEFNALPILKILRTRTTPIKVIAFTKDPVSIPPWENGRPVKTLQDMLDRIGAQALNARQWKNVNNKESRTPSRRGPISMTGRVKTGRSKRASY